MKSLPPILLSLPLLFVTYAADAVAIYKYVLPNGSVLYSQTELKHRRPAKVLHVAPPTPAQRKEQQEAQQQLRQLQVRSDVLAMELTAQQAVDNVAAPPGPAALSDSAVAQVLVPLPGERIANANGSSRLTDAYWQRVYAELGPGYPLQSGASSAGQ